jgi:hypothetical protein
MSCILVLLMAIDVVVKVVFWGCPDSPFMSNGAGAIRKVTESVTFVFLIGFFL